MRHHSCCYHRLNRNKTKMVEFGLPYVLAHHHTFSSIMFSYFNPYNNTSVKQSSTKMDIQAHHLLLIVTASHCTFTSGCSVSDLSKQVVVNWWRTPTFWGCVPFLEIGSCLQIQDELQLSRRMWTFQNLKPHSASWTNWTVNCWALNIYFFTTMSVIILDSPG